MYRCTRHFAGANLRFLVKGGTQGPLDLDLFFFFSHRVYLEHLMCVCLGKASALQAHWRLIKAKGRRREGLDITMTLPRE